MRKSIIRSRIAAESSRSRRRISRIAASSACPAAEADASSAARRGINRMADSTSPRDTAADCSRASSKTCSYALMQGYEVEEELLDFDVLETAAPTLLNPLRLASSVPPCDCSCDSAASMAVHCSC